MAAADLSPLERLLAEAVPAGTFGHARPAPAPSPAPRRGARATKRSQKPPARWTPEEQAQHVAELEAALDAIESRGPAMPGRRLRVVNSDAA